MYVYIITAFCKMFSKIQHVALYFNLRSKNSTVRRSPPEVLL